MPEENASQKTSFWSLSSKDKIIAAILIIVVIVFGTISLKLSNPQFEGYFGINKPTPQSPTLTPKPQPPPIPTNNRIVKLDEYFTMKEGEEVAVAETLLKIKVKQVKPPPPGAIDLPYNVTVQVSYEKSTQEFNLTFGGGGFVDEVTKGRQKDIFGFNIYLQQVTTLKEVTFIVKKINNIEPSPSPEPPPTPGNNISWEEAKQLVLTGQVTSVSQGHNLIVTLRLKDGSIKTAKEPAIDDIFAVIKSCGTVCTGILKASE